MHKRVFFNLKLYIIIQRLFGSTGQCTTCNKIIQAYEFVMKVNSLVFHVECFRCTICHKE